jgi:hypothetical protein
VKPELKLEVVDEDVIREAKPGAPDEQVKGYRRRNGTFVAAYQRGPKKHRKKAQKQMELAA